MILPSARKARKLVIPATTLDEARHVLNPDPLDFQTQPDVANALYTPHVARVDQPANMLANSPSNALTYKLLDSTFETKAFLSGHVGSGKSTELRKVAASKEITAAFFPIILPIEAGYWDDLDIEQLLFLIACAVYDYAKQEKLLKNPKSWEKPYQLLLDWFAGLEGVKPVEGTVGLEFDLVFVKLKQDLKLGEHRRKQFRLLGETRPQVLTELLTGLVVDMLTTAQARGDDREPVVFIDDLDKVRESKPQDATFRKRPAAFFEPPLRIVYTIPTGVAFNDCPQRIREHLDHLYPAPTSKKAPNSYNPEDANVVNDTGIHFLETVLKPRVQPHLIESEAIRLAAIYSGGMLRNFFLLLRTGIDTARLNDRRQVDKTVMRVAIKSARLNESMSLHEQEYKALAAVHKTNFLAQGNANYLDQSWVVECFNDKVWYEANPLLWKVLDPNHT